MNDYGLCNAKVTLCALAACELMIQISQTNTCSHPRRTAMFPHTPPFPSAFDATEMGWSMVEILIIPG